MKVIKQNGQICDVCKQFTKKFIVCEACHKKICHGCAEDDNFCMECFIRTQGNKMVKEYNEEKYVLKI